MVRRSSSILLLIASLASAQTFENLLPAGAKIIETTDVSRIAKKPRILVLWMVDPSKHVGRPDARYCGDDVHGDYWSGPTRLSLVDPAEGKIVNNVTVAFPPDHDGRADEFWLPFRVPNTYYKVPRADKEKWGAPHLLDLRDLTGDGIPAEFPLFIYDACGIASGSVFGYSVLFDAAVQYPVLILENNEKPRVESWIMQVFSRKPVSSGHWKFTWLIAHGSEDIYHEDVTFDHANQRFVEKLRITQPIVKR